MNANRKSTSKIYLSRANVGMTRREFIDKFGECSFKKHNGRYYASGRLVSKENDRWAKQLFDRQERRGKALSKRLAASEKREERQAAREARLALRMQQKADREFYLAEKKAAREQAKQLRLAEREEKARQRAEAKELRQQNRINERRIKLQERSKMAFRYIGKQYRRQKAYKPYAFWYHGELPEDTKPMLRAIKLFLSKRPRLKLTMRMFNIVDGYLVAKKMDARSKAALENFVTAYLLGSGFYFAH